MKIVVDENVSADVGVMLRSRGHQVVVISEMAHRGITDRDVWDLILKERATLITRDYHFTNPIRACCANHVSVTLSKAKGLVWSYNEILRSAQNDR